MAIYWLSFRALRAEACPHDAELGRGAGQVMIHGKGRVEEAGRLYARAAAMKPRDALEALDVEAAREEMS